MTSQTSSLNIAIKTCKQPKQSITAENKIRKEGKQRNSHVRIKTQQMIISQAFKIIIRDTRNFNMMVVK